MTRHCLADPEREIAIVIKADAPRAKILRRSSGLQKRDMNGL